MNIPSQADDKWESMDRIGIVRFLFVLCAACQISVSEDTSRFIRYLSFIGSPSATDAGMTFSSCALRCFYDSKCASYLFSSSGHCQSLPYVLPIGGSVRTDYSYFLKEKAHRCVKTGYSFSGQYDICYKTHQEKVTYNQSHTKCEEEAGARLLRIDSPLKQTFVETVLSMPVVPEKYRIDGNLDNDTKIWSFADGHPISDFYWHPNEPHDDVSGHLCIGLRVAYGLQWDDVLCDNKWGYICERVIT